MRIARRGSFPFRMEIACRARSHAGAGRRICRWLPRPSDLIHRRTTVRIVDGPQCGRFARSWSCKSFGTKSTWICPFVCAARREARLFARERWKKAPLLAGYRRGLGAVLWVAAPPGTHGYDRFPYLLHALTDLGLDPPFQSRRLWAFFDSAYRSRVDLDYFAARWRASGISALHVAAWHFWERDPQNDEYIFFVI